MKLSGTAAPIRIANVDTDMIIPAHWLKTVKRTGLGAGLFQKNRYHDDGRENPDFVLNMQPYREAKIIVADDNFGCGSSREHAVWALLDFGIRCVISTAFGEIFYNNCFKNGLLPIVVSKGQLDTLFSAADHTVTNQLEIDLEGQEIRISDGRALHFDIDPFRKHCLLNGLDDIALTEQRQSEIDRFEERVTAARPWA
jgi:3-isopropylmalate/(R)-2-methylmalate dehydratase small subunit